MPFADCDGVRIHYEVDGSGPPLLLLHAFTSSSVHWRRLRYVEALENEWRVIQVDSRGHGDSDKPRRPESYSPFHMASDVVAVLDDLGEPGAALWGFSMGAKVAFAVAHHFPQRISKYIFGGTHPYRRPDDRRDSDQFILELKEHGIAGWVEQIERRTGRPMSEWRRTQFLANDIQALLAADEALAGEWVTDATLKRIEVPCLLYAGEDDPRIAGLREAAKAIKNAEFFSLPGLNHLPAWGASDQVLPKVTEFLRRGSSASPGKLKGPN